MLVIRLLPVIWLIMACDMANHGTATVGHMANYDLADVGHTVTSSHMANRGL